ncbi:MAG: RIP metalloprotease RseP, partial [Alphaproteobacteria bacterium]
ESPAEKAGIKTGDIILSIGRFKVKKFEDLKNRILLNKEKNIELKVKRGEEIKTLLLSPKTKDGVPQIGVIARTSLEDMKRVGVIEAGAETFREMTQSVATMFKGLGQIASGKRSAKELGGFISIAQMSGRAVESGFYSFLFFIAFISMNLGVINLFPIPGLDGGQLMFFTYEWIRGKPVHLKFQIITTYIGFGLLIFLMGYSTLNDIIRLF